MKISVFGISDFPLGKKIIPDARLDKLKELLRPPKTTYPQLEVNDEKTIKDGQGIISLAAKKLDLILLDLELIENRLLCCNAQEKEFLQRIQPELEKESLLNELNLSDNEIRLAQNLNFITLKPILFLTEENFHDSASAIKNIYQLCNMICFFTSNQNELRSWPLKKGQTAFDAAGFVHSDIQRGFIKAEVFNFKDVEELGGFNQAKTRAMHLESKDYIVKDADIINFRFNV
ncbi:MAG: DUF933 domain-containing protein [Candidatus Omnitrophota bacterium]|nr:DUF933 domain-containing protein [Candidatus Omnitrophota bacterium]